MYPLLISPALAAQAQVAGLPPRLSLPSAKGLAALLNSQFAYIYDHPSQTVQFLSDGIMALLGERPALADLTPAWFAERLHPDEVATVLRTQGLVERYLVEQAAVPLPNFLFSLDFRLRHAHGHYRRVLRQQLLLERAPGPGAVRRSLLLFTDLSHHKLTHEVSYHVNQPDFEAFAARQPTAAPVLTAREQQVLALVLRGLTSRQIAYYLHLGEHTVRAHRRNIRRKTGSRSLHDLLGHLPPS